MKNNCTAMTGKQTASPRPVPYLAWAKPVICRADDEQRLYRVIRRPEGPVTVIVEGECPGGQVMKPWNIEICDVTLRDGEQTCLVSCDEKVEIARMLDMIGIEVIEAGFPAVSANEKKCVTAIANLGLDSRICCLARARKPDVDAAIESDVDMVSIFIATSDLHIRLKYKKPGNRFSAKHWHWWIMPTTMVCRSVLLPKTHPGLIPFS